MLYKDHVFLRKTLTFLLQLPATSGSPGAAFARGVSSSVVLQPLVGRTDSFLRGLLPTTCHSETTGRPGFLLGLWLNSTCGQCLSVCIDVGIILNMYADYHRFTSRLRCCFVVAHWLFVLWSLQSRWMFLSWNSLLMSYKLQVLELFVRTVSLYFYMHMPTYTIIYVNDYFFQHFHRSSNWTIVFGALSLLSWHQYIIFNSLHYPFWILLGFFLFRLILNQPCLLLFRFDIFSSLRPLFVGRWFKDFHPLDSHKII